MLKIWGRMSSLNVQKVVICANELGLEYERIDAGGKFGVVDTPEYRKLNPNGLVPTIEDGDFVLWESNAIVRYLARVYGEGGLWPGDPRVAADADRWMDWQATRAAPAMTDAFLQLVRTPAEKRDMSAAAASIAKSEPVMAILDAHLAARRYVAGEYSMADIPVAATAHRWIGLPCEKQPRPNVEAYVSRVASRPAYQGILAMPLT